MLMVPENTFSTTRGDVNLPRHETGLDMYFYRRAYGAMLHISHTVQLNLQSEPYDAKCNVQFFCSPVRSAA